jgi:hypothetical protein
MHVEELYRMIGEGMSNEEIAVKMADGIEGATYDDALKFLKAWSGRIRTLHKANTRYGALNIENQTKEKERGQAG